jgi:hypothetical protein
MGAMDPKRPARMLEISASLPGNCIQSSSRKFK